jgi:tetratricopeptide (TPR) repeat protein
MRTKILYLLPALVILIALVMGCGPKPLPPESILDTPDNHYNMGIREYDRGNFDKALEEFNRAINLNPNYAEGFSGQALVWAQKGDFEQALTLADKGIDKNDKSLDVHVIKGRVVAMQRKGETEEWLKKAVKEFDKALEINPNSAKALYYKGEAYKDAYAFGDAAAAFTKVIELKGDFAQQANDEWALVQKIQRAAPGTKVGMKIALINQIDRADLAVLLMEELKLMEIMQKKRPQTFDTGFKAPEDPTKMQTSTTTQMADVTDIADHWAKNWIEEIVKERGMDVFPDHTFRPDEKITRANYAMVIQNILMMATGDESLATKYIGSTSRFPDINPSHYAYNAICLVVDRGIMSADKMSGAFKLNDNISGADALLIIRDFQNALRMTF